VAFEKENKLGPRSILGSGKVIKSRSPPLGKKPIPGVGKFHGRGAFLVVVRHAVNATAYGKASHRSGIAGLQQFGSGFDLCHAGIEPNVVAVWIEDHWHPVVEN